MKLRRLKKFAKMRPERGQSSVVATLYSVVPSSWSENHFSSLLWASAGSQPCVRRHSMTDT